MLEKFAGYIAENLLMLEPGTRISSSVEFFIADTIKIFILLFTMITLMGILRTYISQERIKDYLGRKKEGVSNFFASLFGAVTPFCSCSSIPLFLGFLEAGIPLGTTFSFLITSPLINEYLVVVMLGFFGWKITLAYVVSGLIIGTLSGFILGKMKLEKHLVKDLIAKKAAAKKNYTSLKSRIRFGLDEAAPITRKIWLWLLIGIALGSIIHNYIPQDSIRSVIVATGVLAVPIAVLLGVPMYGSCAAVVPVAVALFDKGVPLGTALAFMMAISALSFPEAIILRRAMRLKLIMIFFSIVALGMIITGYFFNFLQNFL